MRFPDSLGETGVSWFTCGSVSTVSEVSGWWAGFPISSGADFSLKIGTFKPFLCHGGTSFL